MSSEEPLQLAGESKSRYLKRWEAWVSCHPNRVGRRSRPDTSNVQYLSDNDDDVDEDNAVVDSSASDEGVVEEELNGDADIVVVLQQENIVRGQRFKKRKRGRPKKDKSVPKSILVAI